VAKERRKSTRKPGAQPGNLNALKHGFYGRQLTTQEVGDLEVAMDRGLDDEIIMFRVMTRRVWELGSGVSNLDTAMEVLNTLGMASIRLASMLRVRKLVGDDSGASAGQALALALSEVCTEMGIGGGRG
jgi:hypothetical protein